MLDKLLTQLPFDGTMIAILAAFVLTYLIAKIFYFTPVLDLLDERASEIATAEDAYQEARADVTAELETQRAKMAAERSEARAERDAIRREALQAREEMVAETQRLADDKLKAAGSELDSVVATESKALEAKAIAIADAMTAKILRKAS